MSQLSSVKQSLENAKRSWPMIADLTGVPYSTICKIGCGHTKNPRSDTVQRLADYFDSLNSADAAHDIPEGTRCHAQ